MERSYTTWGMFVLSGGLSANHPALAPWAYVSAQSNLEFTVQPPHKQFIRVLNRNSPYNDNLLAESTKADGTVSPPLHWRVEQRSFAHAPIDVNGSALLAYARGPTLQANNTGPLTLTGVSPMAQKLMSSARRCIAVIIRLVSHICFAMASIRTQMLCPFVFAPSTTERPMLNIKQQSDGQFNVIAQTSSNRCLPERAYTKTNKRYGRKMMFDNARVE